VTNVFQTLLSGLLSGGVYALPAVGLSLIWGVMKIVNIAHGVLALLGSYLALTLFRALGIDPLLAAVLMLPVFFLIGMIVQHTLVRPVINQPEISSLMILFAFTIVLENVITRVWTGDFRAMTPAYSGMSLDFAGANLSVVRTITFGLAVVAVFGLDALLARTYIGKAIRATAQNQAAAMLAGIDTDRVALIAFGIGTALAGVAGVALGLIYSFHPSVHILWVVKSFLVTVLGGVGNIRGAFAAGLLLGVAESFLGTYVSFRWVDFFIYGLLLLVLLLRPQGLLRGAASA
jgi:branched-chain amino acid transport system permease protein